MRNLDLRSLKSEIYTALVSETCNKWISGSGKDAPGTLLERAALLNYSV